MELEPPPQPVPRRKRAFIAPNAMAPQGLPPPDPEVVLDGFVLLEACRVEDPDEAEKAVLEGCGISSVVSEDLSFFKRLTHLDLGDNHVQLASLAYLPALLELHLDCNGLVGLSCPAGGFPTLEVLNLSYNGVDAEAVATLADLPKLRQLDLSKNELSALPADMSGFAELQVPPPRAPAAAAAAVGSARRARPASLVSPRPPRPTLPCPAPAEPELRAQPSWFGGVVVRARLDPQPPLALARPQPRGASASQRRARRRARRPRHARPRAQPDRPRGGAAARAAAARSAHAAALRKPLPAQRWAPPCRRPSAPFALRRGSPPLPALPPGSSPRASAPSLTPTHPR